MGVGQLENVFNYLLIGNAGCFAKDLTQFLHVDEAVFVGVVGFELLGQFVDSNFVDGRRPTTNNLICFSLFRRLLHVLQKLGFRDLSVVTVDLVENEVQLGSVRLDFDGSQECADFGTGQFTIVVQIQQIKSFGQI